LKPEIASGVVDEITSRKQQRIKQQYDRAAKELPALAELFAFSLLSITVVGKIHSYEESP